ncbi:hypothetical protein ADK54_10330 [Streptomyces sp. WM6378]|nr:hypothetical protein ADK54_10330 [Streptomyces sp. WM6378]
MAFTCLLSGAGSAAAGTNGQKLYFHQVYSQPHATYSVLVQGYNEQGRWVTGCFNTEGAEWKTLDGWWWVGQVAYSTYPFYNCQGTRIYSNTAQVPKDQGSQDWVVIQG